MTKATEALNNISNRFDEMEEYIYDQPYCPDWDSEYDVKDFTTVSDELAESEKKDTVLKILFEKNVQINSLKKCKTVEEYNILWTTDPLTEEEFVSVKYYFEKMTKGCKNDL